MKKQIKRIVKAVESPIHDLVTFRAMPTADLQHLDPFLFLNHHGYQVYSKNNNGLPFGPHPHRGFETLTFVVKGEIMHMDSGGHKSVIHTGGVQWMTAGKGIIHSEISSDTFKAEGGEIEILQLWMNLPARLKMIDHKYVGLEKESIPVVKFGKSSEVQVISGELLGAKGAVDSVTNLTIGTFHISANDSTELAVPVQHETFFYVVSGTVLVNGQEVGKRNTVLVSQEGEEIQFKALENAVVIVGMGKPYKEPIVAHGPFVMNSAEEINQAIRDYQSGKMGVWPF